MFQPGHFVDYKNSRLHYAKSGNGPKALLLFHGFGQNFTAFEKWGNSLNPLFTLYSFDLYFHGLSTWPMAGPLEKSQWREILESFLRKEGIDRFAVTGYSLGGKFALATTALFAHKIDNLTLIAADGVTTNIWYTLATWPLPARLLFRTMVRHPGRFADVVRWLKAAKVVHHGILRFAETQMDTSEKRSRVYHAWVWFRHLRTDMKKVSRLINEMKIPTTIVIGRFDKMITVRQMKPLLSQLTHPRLEVEDTGHTGIIGAAARFVLD